LVCRSFLAVEIRIYHIMRHLRNSRLESGGDSLSSHPPMTILYIPKPLPSVQKSDIPSLRSRIHKNGQVLPIPHTRPQRMVHVPTSLLHRLLTNLWVSHQHFSKGPSFHHVFDLIPKQSSLYRCHWVWSRNHCTFVREWKMYGYVLQF
jgi:hypothetical protein